jgi:hypothetical protein
LTPERLAMREFFAPASLAAVVVMGVNDHLLKARLHNAFTGKLSDVTGCFFLPLFLSAVLGLIGGWRLRTRVAVGGVLTALVFTTLELSTRADALFGRAVSLVGGPLGIHGASMTRDLTDLWALAFVPAGCLYGLNRARQHADSDGAQQRWSERSRGANHE